MEWNGNRGIEAVPAGKLERDRVAEVPAEVDVQLDVRKRRDVVLGRKTDRVRLV